jgi:hypothetical protein
VGSYEDYRDKALQCLAAADHISDPKERLALLEIAQSWMRLAKHVASRESGSAPPDEEGG